MLQRVAVILGLILALGGGIWFALESRRPVPVTVPELPDTPPVVTSEDRPWTPDRFDDPFRERGDDLIDARNELVGQLRTALASAAASPPDRGALRRAEAIYARVLVAQHQRGEIDAQALHEGLARIFERELARVRERASRTPPEAGRLDLEVLGVYVARERLLAAGAAPDADPDELASRTENYAKARSALLTYQRARIEAFGSRPDYDRPLLDDQLATFENEFPAVEDLREAGRLPPANEPSAP